MPPNKYLSKSQEGLEACIAQAGTEPLILPPPPPMCWDFKHAPPWPAGESGPFYHSRVSHRTPVCENCFRLSTQPRTPCLLCSSLIDSDLALHILCPLHKEKHSLLVPSPCSRLRFHPGSDQAQTREQPQRAVSPKCPATAELIPHAQPTSLLANSTRG